MTPPKPLLIWGAAGHASVVADAARSAGWEVAGFLDDRDPTPRPFAGGRVLGGRDQLAAVADNGVRHLVFGFGDGPARLELAPLAEAAGFAFATVVHSRAVVATGVPLGAGTVVTAGVVINPGASVGRHVIVNTLAGVDHDCVLEDGCHVCPGVRLAGNVTVGRAAWVGIGAVVVQKISIGAATVVGAGAVVVRDLPPGVVAYGVPARIARRADGVG